MGNQRVQAIDSSGGLGKGRARLARSGLIPADCSAWATRRRQIASSPLLSRHRAPPMPRPPFTRMQCGQRRVHYKEGALRGISLCRLNENIRWSLVLGFVGAGGIGLQLLTAMNLFQYREVSLLFIITFIVIFTAEPLSALLRQRLSWNTAGHRVTGS
jgi:hypothetical protein